MSWGLCAMWKPCGPMSVEAFRLPWLVVSAWAWFCLFYWIGLGEFDAGGDG